MTLTSINNHPLVNKLLTNRWPQFILQALLLAAFLFTILSGWIGTPVGSHNFGIVFLWITWWALLILVAVPFFGRGWCSICPIPLPGEWLQRGNLLGKKNEAGRSQVSKAIDGIGSSEAPSPQETIHRRWPRVFRNIWLQNGSFLLLGLFSPIILTSPQVTAVVLALMLVLAFATSIFFERRSFCRYLCPVSGFIGLYSQVSPLELRIRNKQDCVTCLGKPCYNGSTTGYGCPWDIFPAGLQKNTNCGLCLECVRVCPKNNISINLRSFATDLVQPLTRMDEAYKSFIMLGSAITYAAVLLGPWGALKLHSYAVFTPGWIGYALAFLGLNLVILPGLFFSLMKLNLKGASPRAGFTAFSTILIPLGLMFWLAFSLSFLASNVSYIGISLSDPLGWGWNLIGTAGLGWQPIGGFFIQPLQVLSLVGGLGWSTQLAIKMAKVQNVSPLPAIIFCLLTTLIMLWLIT